jgi:hypothetical protein
LRKISKHNWKVQKSVLVKIAKAQSIFSDLSSRNKFRFAQGRKRSKKCLRRKMLDNIVDEQSKIIECNRRFFYNLRKNLLK